MLEKFNFSSIKFWDIGWTEGEIEPRNRKIFTTQRKSEKIFQASESRGDQCDHLESDMEDAYSDEEMYDEYEEEEEEEEEEEMDDTKERLAWDKDV